jgi:hypothetical protein
MNKRFFLVAFITLLFLGIRSVNAQEADPEVQEEAPLVHTATEDVPNPNEIGALESKSSPSIRPESSGNKPANSTTPTTSTNKKDKQSEKSEDDALSFNFLYYIIQKFKISDLKNN